MNHSSKVKTTLTWICLTLLPLSAQAEVSQELTESEQAETQSVEKTDLPSDVEAVPVEIDESQPVALSVQELKRKVIELNRDLFILEEDLLFPANTQFTVFLSMDSGQFLKLDSVKLKVNDEIVAAHLYTSRQIKALQRGGMQRLYIGNLKSGKHEVVAIVEGIGPDDRVYKKAASLMIEKGTDLKALEIKISDQSSDYQPAVALLEWD